MPLQATAYQTDPTPSIHVTEVPHSPVDVFLMFRDGEAPRQAVVREGTPPDVVTARIAQLTAEWAATYATPAEMEAQCLDPDNVDCRCPSCSSLLAEDAVYGEPRITVSDGYELVAFPIPFDDAVASDGDGDDQADTHPGYRHTLSGEGIERMRSVQDEHAAHEALLANNRDPVTTAGHAVRQLAAVTDRAANANHAAATDTSRAEQVTRWVEADRVSEAASRDELAVTR